LTKTIYPVTLFDEKPYRSTCTKVAKMIENVSETTYTSKGKQTSKSIHKPQMNLYIKKEIRK